MQRAHYSKRRKEIWEALHPEPSVDYGREDGGEEEIQVGQLVPPEIGYKKPPPQVQSFAAATAEVTGQSKRDINRNVARAEAIGDDLLRLTGTSLDKGVELDALAKLPEPERKELIERAVAGEVVTARVAPPPTPQKTTSLCCTYHVIFLFRGRDVVRGCRHGAVRCLIDILYWLLHLVASCCMASFRGVTLPP